MSVIVKWSVFKRPKPPAESGWHLSRYYSPPPPTLPPTRPRCTPLTYTCHTQDITPVTSEKLNFVNTILYLSRTSELKTLMYVGGREYFFCLFVGLQCLVSSAHLFWPQQHTWARPLTPKPTYDSIYSNTQVTLLFLRSFLQMEILRKVSKTQNTKWIFSKVYRRQCCQ